jgi:hypothetical protein
LSNLSTDTQSITKSSAKSIGPASSLRSSPEKSGNKKDANKQNVFQSNSKLLTDDEDRDMSQQSMLAINNAMTTTLAETPCEFQRYKLKSFGREKIIFWSRVRIMESFSGPSSSSFWTRGQDFTTRFSLLNF